MINNDYFDQQDFGFRKCSDRKFLNDHFKRMAKFSPSCVSNENTPYGHKIHFDSLFSKTNSEHFFDHTVNPLPVEIG